jgi:hypothetical protein
MNWLAAHWTHILAGLGTAAGIIFQLIQWAIQDKDYPAWALANPRKAAMIRLLGALGPQFLPALQASVDLKRGTLSPGSVAAAKTLAVSSSTPLIAPPPLIQTPPKDPTP